MARLTNEQLNDMTGRQKRAYADTNPSEGLRLAKSSIKDAKYCASKYAKYTKTKIAETLIPGLKDLNLEEE